MACSNRNWVRLMAGKETTAGSCSGHTPTPEEIRALRQKHGKTMRECADLVHATLGGWQQWEYKNAASGKGRTMSPAFWELFRLKIGDLKLDKFGNSVPAEAPEE